MRQHPAEPDQQPGTTVEGNRIMAKGNRTTSTARRATAAKATFRPSDILCRLEDEAHAEVFGLQHLSELMGVWGDHVGTPYAGWSNMDMQEIGNRIEYLGGLVKRHADAISNTLGEVRSTAERLPKAGAELVEGEG